MAVYRYRSDQEIPMRALQLATHAIHHRSSATRGPSKLAVRSRLEMTPDPDHIEAFWFNTMDKEWRMWTKWATGSYVAFHAPSPDIIEKIILAEEEARAIAESIATDAVPKRAPTRI